jgi:hypothetical protein
VNRIALLLAFTALVLPGTAHARGSGGEFEQRRSPHFVLQQDAVTNERGGFRGSRRFEQQLLEELERAYDALDEWLALRPKRRIDVVVYDADRFDAEFAGRFRLPRGGLLIRVTAVRAPPKLDRGALARGAPSRARARGARRGAPTLWLPAGP